MNDYQGPLGELLTRLEQLEKDALAEIDRCDGLMSQWHQGQHSAYRDAADMLRALCDKEGWWIKPEYA